MFDSAFLDIAEPEDASSAPAIDLFSLKSLNPLHARISAINASRLFHCFTEEKKQLHQGFRRCHKGSILYSIKVISVRIAGIEVGTKQESHRVCSQLEVCMVRDNNQSEISITSTSSSSTSRVCAESGIFSFPPSESSTYISSSESTTMTPSRKLGE